MKKVAIKKATKKPARKPVARRALAKAAETVLVMRTCAADMSSHSGFVWPKSGPVECKDWKSVAECGNGLHGLLWGAGDATLLNWGDGAPWLVVEVPADSIVDLGGKVKFPRGVVLYCGDRKGAAELIATRAPPGTPIVGGTSTSGYGGTSTSGVGGTSTSGDRGTSTSGDRGTSTSGDRGTSTSGYGGTSTSGYGGTSTSGDRGTSTSGYGGTSTSGDGGTSTSGDRGTSTSGDRGTSTSGDRGTSTSGDRGTSTSGYGGTSTSGYGGTSTSGDGGVITICFYDSSGNWRRRIGQIGENGLEPNVAYVIQGGEFVRKDSAK